MSTSANKTLLDCLLLGPPIGFLLGSMTSFYLPASQLTLAFLLMAGVVFIPLSRRVPVWASALLVSIAAFCVAHLICRDRLDQALQSLPEEQHLDRSYRIDARFLYSWETRYGRAMKIDLITIISPEAAGFELDRLTLYVPKGDVLPDRYGKIQTWIRLKKSHSPHPIPWPLRSLIETYRPGFYGTVKSSKLMDYQAGSTLAPQRFSEGLRQLLSAFLAGVPSPIWRERLEPFGLGHLLAISGLHCIFVYLLIQILLIPLRNPWLRVSLTILGLVSFAHWVGWSTSVTRASMMLCLWVLLPGFGRIRSWRRLWFGMLCIGILSDPLVLLQRGFWYSFGASLGLILGANLRKPTPLDHPVLVRVRPLLPIVSAQLFVIPINLMFDGFSRLTSVFWNFLGMAFLVFILVLLVATLLFWALQLPSAPLDAVDRVVGEVLSWLGHVQGGWELVRFPATPMMVICALLAIGCCFTWGHRQNRWYLAIICLVLFTCFNRPWRGERLMMLDVGQGLCMLYVSEDGSGYLFDAGGKLPAGLRLDRLARLYGARQIVAAYISHHNWDHYNLLETMPRGFPVWVPSLQLTDFSAHENLRHYHFKPLQRQAVHQIGASRLDVLWPDPEPGKTYPNTNEQSLVMMLDGGPWQVLFTGDAGIWTENQLVFDQIDDKLVLQIGHHGSKTATSNSFLDKFEPDAALISCGESNRFSHPHHSVVTRLDERKIPIWITSDSGSLEVMAGGVLTLPARP